MARRPGPKRDDLSDLRDLRAGLYCRVSLDQTGDEKSVNDQEHLGRKWAEAAGVNLDERHIYRDANRSASRFATKQRENYERMKADIEDSELDVIWVWELSRIARDQAEFSKFRNLCRDHGVLWVNKDRIEDPSDWKGMLGNAVQAMTAEMASEETSERVLRGKQSSAYEGRPASRVPYGYTRNYHPTTGKWESDIPNTHDGDGVPVEDTPAYIVRQIYDLIGAGHSITSIRKDLNDRGIPSPGGTLWDNSRVRYIAMSPTYIAQRVYRAHEHNDSGRYEYRAKAVLPDVVAQWPALVDEATWYAVQSILNDPKRRTTRFGPRTGQYLLTALALCDECGAKLVRRRMPADNKRTKFVDGYACRGKGCIGIPMAKLDEYVEEVVVGWLSDPNTAADLLGGEDDSATAKQARADAERGRAELQQLKVDLAKDNVSATAFTIAERRLEALIADADRRVQESTLPPVLAGNIGPQAAALWAKRDVAAKRLMIRTIAEIRVKKVGRGYRVPVMDRVEWKWLVGTNPDEFLDLKGAVG